MTLLSHPYIRLLRWHVPTGASFLFFPCLWGLMVAEKGFPSLWLTFLFAVGAFCLRSAGCIYNDWVDREIDCKVTRTQQRPLAEKSVSFNTACLLIGGLLGVAFWVWVQLNNSARVIAMMFAFLVLFYPWLKRFTYFPQLYLGLLFSSGVWVGWLAVHPDFSDLTLAPCMLYIVGILWTLVYDTLYAYQDYEDDQKIGVKSTAVRLGHKPSVFFRGCMGGVVLFLSGLGVVEHMNVVYWGGVLGVTLHFIWQMRHFKVDEPEKCGRLFRMNQWVGILITLSLGIGYMS